MSRIDEREAVTYFPPPESKGAWRWLRTPAEVRGVGGMEPGRLQFACEANAVHAATSSVVVVRRGYVVAEWHELSALTTTRHDIWSATKSFTGTAYGLLFEESRQGRLPSGLKVDLDTPV